MRVGSDSALGSSFFGAAVLGYCSTRSMGSLRGAHRIPLKACLSSARFHQHTCKNEVSCTLLKMINIASERISSKSRNTHQSQIDVINYCCVKNWVYLAKQQCEDRIHISLFIHSGPEKVHDA